MPQLVIRELSELRFAQSVLEVRFPKTHTYWDVSGKAIESIEQRLPGLVCQHLEPEGFRFTGIPDRGLTSATFYWNKVTASIMDLGAPAIPKKFSHGASE